MMGEEATKQKRCVGYIRVSTVEQHKHGESLAGQRRTIREFAERNNYELVDIYADEGISGRTIKARPGVQQLIEDSKADKFDVVVIWKLTRLGRSMKDVLSISEILYANNVELRSISESFDINSSSGRMLLGMLANFAEFERAQTSENVKMSMMSIVKNQNRYPGGLMLGYRSGENSDGEKTLLIKEDEAETVRLIYKLYLEGHGYRAIANQLNSQNLKTVRGNTFSTTAVKDILKNVHYVGKIKYNQYENWTVKRRKGYNPNYIVAEGNHEPIIDEDTFNRVQDRLKIRSRQPKWNNRGENLLTGLLRCPECEGAMAASNTTNTLKDGTKKRIRYYSCANFRRKGSSVCHANSVRADEAEKFVLERLKEIILVPEHIKQIVDEMNEQIEANRKPWEMELNGLDGKIEETEEKLKKWQELVKSNPELTKELEGRMTELEIKYIENKHRKDELLKLLQAEGYKVTTEDVFKVMKVANRAIMDSDSKADTKEILRTFIDKITFDKETKADYLIYTHFSKEIVDRLNDLTKEEPTAGMNAVGSFTFSAPLELII